jgi:four helix bundle protein
MKPAKKFQDLVVWQKAHQFVLAVYKETNRFPDKEKFGLVLQFRRAAVSIAANITEGFKKTKKPDKARYFNIAQGSLEECRYYIILSADLQYCDPYELEEKSEEVSKLLISYSKAILL